MKNLLWYKMVSKEIFEMSFQDLTTLYIKTESFTITNNTTYRQKLPRSKQRIAAALKTPQPTTLTSLSPQNNPQTISYHQAPNHE